MKDFETQVLKLQGASPEVVTIR